MPDSIISVRLEIHSKGIHVEQILTGFRMLEWQGHIRCMRVYDKERIARCKKLGFKSSYSRCVMAVVNGKKVCYDLNDGESIVEELLNISDYYFKRGFQKAMISQNSVYSSKVHPLGLNYLVYPDLTDFAGIVTSLRLVSFPHAIRESLHYLPAFDFVDFVPRVSNTRKPPVLNQQPKALYMARLWDPHDLPGRTEKSVQDRISVNESRVKSIKRLKQELKSGFTGGLVKTEYAEKVCRELIIDDKSVTSLKNYLNLVQQHPICVSTLGLAKSTPWKFAHYVAFSRAIVTEPLYYDVVGDFHSGVHYSEIKSEDECVEQVMLLFENKVLREEMMERNWQYYQDFLSPDKLVLNTLRQIIQS